jgi:hypothetical protein
VKRPLLVLAAGLIGLLLGVGLSLVADALAGNDLSEPVPLGIATDAVRTTPSPSADHDRPAATQTPDRKDDHGGEPTETETPEPSETHPSSDDDAGSHDDAGGSGHSDTDDD